MVKKVTCFACIVGLLWVCMPGSVVAQQNPEAELAAEYMLDGEYDKAIPIFEKLYKLEPQETSHLTKLIECYTRTKRFDDAISLLNKAVRQNNRNYTLVALKCLVLQQAGRKEEAYKLWVELTEKTIQDPIELAAVGAYVYQQQQYEMAEKAYLRARRLARSETLFANELSTVHVNAGNYEKATEELLRHYQERPDQVNLIRAQIVRMANKTNAAQIEKPLLAAAARNASDGAYREFLYELYLQQENYNEAYVQARSLDRLQRERGQRVFTLAQTAQNNNQYDLANKALQYIIDNHPNSPYYLQAYLERAKNFERKAFETRPLDTLSLRQAVRGYDALFAQFGRNEFLAEAMLRKAHLTVFYLNDLAAGLREVQLFAALPLPEQRKAEAKLLEGDIWLMQGEYNKARIKYSEVEDRMKESQEGARAKYRTARLFYFKGDFEVAKARLKTLKDNSSNDIANDAIQLFLLIQENTGLDSNTKALADFARAQLLLYQRQHVRALPLLDSILYQYPKHPLTDNIYWEKANLLLASEQTDDALFLLDRILDKHAYDTLGDDALFLKAEIVQYVKKDAAQATELYVKLLEQYPGSLYKVEVRKRIRQLRGEKVQ